MGWSASMSSAGGRARARQSKEVLHEVRLSRFAAGVRNLWDAERSDPQLDADAAVDGVLLAFMVAYHERRVLTAAEGLGQVDLVMSGRLRNRLVALRVLVNREALRATRRLSSGWEPVYDLLVAEQARVEAENVRRPVQLARKRARSDHSR